MHGTVEQQPNRLLDRMNHEVRATVNVILGLTELLLESDLTPEQVLRVSTARSSADRLLSESSRILDLSRAEAGTLVLRTMNFDLRETVHQTVELLSIFAGPRDIELMSVVSDELPPMLVGDAERINQILITLICAGIQRIEHSRIIVTVTPEERVAETVTVKFSVMDQGTRMPPEVLNRMFDGCTDDGGSPQGPSGIALALSKRLAEGMGGGMWVEDGPEPGTVFHFKVQLAMPDLIETDLGPSSPVTRDLRPLKILVAEDAPENLLLIQAFLKDHPWSIDSAANGKIALHKAITSSYNLILMDLDMPEMDGHTATRFIRSSECQNEKPAVPIVALTAFDEAEARLKSIEAGCTAHVTKPISKSALIETIQHYAR